MRYSIITVSYNSEKTIERTIKSILAQSEKDYEYIIVDGASKDCTVKLIKQYEPLFEGRLHWISESDKGIYNAMNKGISMAKGDVIGIVNSDDWLETDALITISEAINTLRINTKSSFVLTGWMKFHYKDGSVQVIKRTYEQFLSGTKKYDMYLNHPATWVSSEAYKGIGYFDENIKIAADNDLILRLHFNKIPFHFISVVITNMADGGVSNHFSTIRLKDRKMIINKYGKSIINKLYLLVSYYIKELVKWILPLKLIRKIKNVK